MSTMNILSKHIYDKKNIIAQDNIIKSISYNVDTIDIKEKDIGVYSGTFYELTDEGTYTLSNTLAEQGIETISEVEGTSTFRYAIQQIRFDTSDIIYDYSVIDNFVDNSTGVIYNIMSLRFDISKHTYDGYDTTSSSLGTVLSANNYNDVVEQKLYKGKAACLFILKDTTQNVLSCVVSFRIREVRGTYEDWVTNVQSNVLLKHLSSVEKQEIYGDNNKKKILFANNELCQNDTAIYTDINRNLNRRIITLIQNGNTVVAHINQAIVTTITVGVRNNTNTQHAYLVIPSGAINSNAVPLSQAELSYDKNGVAEIYPPQDEYSYFAVQVNSTTMVTGKIKTPVQKIVAQNTIELYDKGKETAVIRCSISDYYSKNGVKVIDIKTPNKMCFDIGDEVIPMVYTAKGVDMPMSTDKAGNAKVFIVVGIKIYYDGAVWQELTLQEK